ncbi:unnamed protein product [Rhizoctonia solani]|uniref:Uncharacterized protein n=1 Tax=Rhizoctonia solani TaxID=456999 RepID=A0A8H3GID9_9AGAM|nr:unnamed protein product [Rhizoctonia solani]
MAQQQVDFALLGQSLATAGQQFTLLNEHPAITQANDIRRLTRLVEEGNQRQQRMEEQLTGLREDIREVKQGLKNLDDHSVARALNSSVHRDENIIYPLVLLNGQVPDDFPETLGELKMLDARSLRGFLEGYGLTVPRARSGQLAVLMRHIGVAPVT